MLWCLEPLCSSPPVEPALLAGQLHAPASAKLCQECCLGHDYMLALILQSSRSAEPAVNQSKPVEDEEEERRKLSRTVTPSPYLAPSHNLVIEKARKAQHGLSTIRIYCVATRSQRPCPHGPSCSLTTSLKAEHVRGQVTEAICARACLPSAQGCIMHEYYAVKRGHHPGVYSNWEDAHDQVRDFILGLDLGSVRGLSI